MTIPQAAQAGVARAEHEMYVRLAVLTERLDALVDAYREGLAAGEYGGAECRRAAFAEVCSCRAAARRALVLYEAGMPGEGGAA